MKSRRLLNQAIDRLKASPVGLDQVVVATVGRLLADDRTADAIEAMTSDPTVADRIVACCIQSDVMRRDFVAMVKTERQMVQKVGEEPCRADALRDSVKKIKQFVAELDAGPRNSVAAHIALQPGEGDYLRTALSLIAGLIDSRELIANQTLPRIGATNKYGDGAETAAIGWLAESINVISGRPHTRHVAVLVQALLDEADVSEDRVRAALRSRKKRDWRDEREVRVSKK